MQSDAPATQAEPEEAPAQNETPAAEPAKSLWERMEALCESDQELYMHLRGPIDQNSNSVWEGQSKAYDELRDAALANGFESIADAIAVAKAAKDAQGGANGAATTHPGHAVIDEIERGLKVQNSPAWLKRKLDEVRNLL